MVQLSEELVEMLDQEASRRGLSRSALVREALAEFLGSSSEARKVQKLLEGYRRLPQGGPDEWGDLEGQIESVAADTMQRLAAEESARKKRRR